MPRGDHRHEQHQAGDRGPTATLPNAPGAAPPPPAPRKITPHEEVVQVGLEHVLQRVVKRTGMWYGRSDCFDVEDPDQREREDVDHQSPGGECVDELRPEALSGTTANVFAAAPPGTPSTSAARFGARGPTAASGPGPEFTTEAAAIANTTAGEQHRDLLHPWQRQHVAQEPTLPYYDAMRSELAFHRRSCRHT